MTTEYLKLQNKISRTIGKIDGLEMAFKISTSSKARKQIIDLRIDLQKELNILMIEQSKIDING